MRFIICLSLLLACKPLHRTGTRDDSGLRSVSDGRVTLGVVPVTGHSGLDGYALLLCKKNSLSYSTKIFTDDRYCRPALLTESGQQAVFIPDQMKGHDGSINYRDMVTKAAIFMGVAGFGVIGGKYAYRALGKNSDGSLLAFTRNVDNTSRTRNLGKLAKKSSVTKEALDYSKSVRILRQAKNEDKTLETINRLTQAVIEKEDILKSAYEIDSFVSGRRISNSFATVLNKLSDNTPTDEIKKELAKHIDKEKSTLIRRHTRLMRTIDDDAVYQVTRNYEVSLEIFDGFADEVVDDVFKGSSNMRQNKEAFEKFRRSIDEELDKSLNKHEELLQQRKFNFVSKEVDDSRINRITDIVGYGAAGAGTTLLLANTLAPNLFVKHPHGAGGDATLRSHWQKVFIFQDYGFNQVHQVDSIDILLRKIATELGLQVNPRIAGW